MVHTVDVSGARRIKGFLNILRDGSLAVSGFLLFVSIGDRRLLILALVFLLAGYFVGEGRVWAAAALAAAAVVFAGWSFVELRAVEARMAAGGEAAVRSLERSFADFYRFGLWGSAALGGVYVVGLGLAARLRRAVGGPEPVIRRLARLRRRLAAIPSANRSRAALALAASVLCALVVLAPGLVTVGGSLLHLHVGGAMEAFERLLEPRRPAMWLGLAVLLTGVFGTFWFFTRAKRLAALPAADLRNVDRRPPILLLRSFVDDVTPLARTTDSRAWLRSALYGPRWTLEETLEQTLRKFGPVLAIGRPGEPLPPAGAGREYVTNERWRVRVRALIAEARMVVVILGKTAGLEFEYRALAEQGALGKLIVVLPPLTPEEVGSRWRLFAETALGGLDVPTVPARTLAARIAADGEVLAVTCRWRDDEDDYRSALHRCLMWAGLAEWAGRARPTS